jgi:putative (di)nucleoside polyphosphate hydrolase
MVINSQGLVFAGRRTGIVSGEHAWQMPQGGIDEGEDTFDAALRELVEETGISSVSYLASSEGWFYYDFPVEATKRWEGQYIGQTQKWYALRFTGTDDEINLEYSSHIEFSDWRWVSIREIVNLVVPFKRTVYEAVVAEFDHFTRVP